MTNEKPRSRRYMATAMAVAAAMVLAAGSAAAQDADEYTSDYVETDADLYNYYDGGFDDVDTNNDWFYDYYSYDSDLGTEAGLFDDGLSGDGLSDDGLYDDEGVYGDDWGFDDDGDGYYDSGIDWNDSDASDLGGDDAGDEGLFDL